MGERSKKITGTEEKSKGVKKSKRDNKESEKVEVSEDKEISNETEIFEQLPSEIKAVLSMQRFSSSTPHPFSKITEHHIDKILEISAKDDEQKYKDTQQARKFHLLYFLLGILLFIFLTIFLVGKDIELFKEIVKLFIAFAGGLGLGYGISSFKKD